MFMKLFAEIVQHDRGIGAYNRRLSVPPQLLADGCPVLCPSDRSWECCDVPQCRVAARNDAVQLLVRSRSMRGSGQIEAHSMRDELA